MKNKMSKIAFVMLSCVFVLSTCMTVFALTSLSVSNTQNGIKATLNFNKEEYDANEKVDVTLSVRNNNSYAVKNIQTELIVPSTIKLSKGSLKEETFLLNAGESKVQELVLEKVIETDSEVIPSNPQTGDNVVVYIAMMSISAVSLVVIAVNKKWIHKNKVMSLVLGFTLVGAITLTSVVNADVAVKEFIVEGTIKYDGEDVVIKGKVSYDYEIYSKVQIDGVDKGMYAEGNTVNITAEDAPEGKHFAGWTVVKGNVTLADVNSLTTTFVMGAEDVEIKSNYEVNTYTITSTTNEGGTITESVTLNYGESKTFTITANSGYGVNDVTVDGMSVGPITSYTFENVKENHKIEVEFDRAITVKTAQEFRNAVTQDGIIVLANDITLDVNEDVEIIGNIIIHGNDYTINLPTTANVIFSNKYSIIRLVNCHFVGNSFIIMREALISIYNSTFDNKVKLYEDAALHIHNSTFVDMSWDGKSFVIVWDGILGKVVGENLESAVSSGIRVQFKILGGTYYFDPTSYLNAEQYKATQTKDTDGVDIWVVTEK